MTKVTWGINGLFGLFFQIYSPSLEEVGTGTQAGQEPGGRADAEAMEGAAY